MPLGQHEQRGRHAHRVVASPARQHRGALRECGIHEPSSLPPELAQRSEQAIWGKSTQRSFGPWGRHRLPIRHGFGPPTRAWASQPQRCS